MKLNGIQYAVCMALLLTTACALPAELEKKKPKDDLGHSPEAATTANPEPTSSDQPVATSSTPAPPPANVDPSKILMFVDQPDDYFLFTGSGAPVNGCEVSPSLSAGLLLAASDRHCQLSGTPTAASDSAAYTITVKTTDGGASTRNVQIDVKVPNPPMLSGPAVQSYFVGARITDVTISNTGDSAEVCYTTPRFPEGLNISVVAGTCVIAGTPLIEAPQKVYKVFARALDGSRAVTNADVTVQPGSASPFCPKIYDQPAKTLAPGVAISSIVFANTGAPAVSCKVSPALPAGLNISPSSQTCMISGTPSVNTNLETYSVSATGSDGTASTAAVAIIVTALTAPVLENLGSLELSVGLSVGLIQFANSGGPVSTCAVTPPLPAGLGLSKVSGTCKISGNPTTPQGLANYTVNVTGVNSSQSSATVGLSITMPVQSQLLAVNGTFPGKVKNVGLAPGNPNTIYAVVFGGMVHKSTNGGANWTAMCQSRASSDDAYYGNIQVLPGADGAAFVASNTTVDRVSAQSGGPCTQLARSVATTYKNNNFFAISPSGRIYSINSTDYSYSDNAGDTWTQISANKANFHSMVIDPFDSSRILMVLSSSTPSTINGFTLNGVTPLSSVVAANYSQRILMHPTQQGKIYFGNLGTYSLDGGVVWTTGSANLLSEFDATGNAYRINAASGTTKIQKTADITSATPTWSDVYDFGALLFIASEPDIRINGSTIAVLSDSRLFISLNNGSTFAESTFTKGTYYPRSPSVAAKDGTVYLFDEGVIKVSTDDAVSFTSNPIAGISSAYTFGARMLIDSSNSNHVYLYAEKYNSTYSSTMYSTTNGFGAFATFTDGSAGWYSWSSVAGISKADPNVFMALGWGRASRSTDGMATTVKKDITGTPANWFVWYPNVEGQVSPWNSDEMYYIDTSSGNMWKFNYAAGTNTSQNGLLGFSDPAGLDVVKTGASSYELRVVSRTGKVDVSTNGVTFSRRNQSGGIASTSSIIYKTSPSNTNISIIAGNMIASPQQTAISYNGGATWRIFDPGCKVREIAYSTSKAYLACDNERLRYVVP